MYMLHKKFSQKFFSELWLIYELYNLVYIYKTTETINAY